MEQALRALPAALDPLVHVVLVEPQIPANTGNVARTCAALGATLHLVGTLGFSLQDAALRRAGLDYWPSVDLHWHPALSDVETLLGPRRWFFFTVRAARGFHDAQVVRGDVLVFGREDLGLPPGLLDARAEQCVRLPLRDSVRSLNLSTCVGIAAYEALRRMTEGEPA
ncbi:MAG: tRNA (cytidine(34)-2'-O)-methyltransferase [Deltaproteobacteria bacterium]|nr:tRNA (cytidine(34)-2'-O)-methyltransferase [Deltaproteobacteria bacterium]